jgi:DNA-binding MarR family transcriptional regulator
MTNAYLAYRALFIKHIEPHLEIDAHQLEVLETIAIYNEKQGKPISCAHLLSLDRLGSPATIHKNYRQLVDDGYLKQVHCEKDRRLRFIDTTTRAEVLFNKISKLIYLCKNM